MTKLMTINDLSDYLGIPVNTLYQWRSKHYGPRGVRMGKYVRYRPQDVEAWLNDQAVSA